MHIESRLGRRFSIQQAIFRGAQAAFIRLDSSHSRPEVYFVRNESEHDTGFHFLLQLLDPRLCSLEAILTGHIIHNYRSLCTAVIHGGQRPVPAWPSSRCGHEANGKRQPKLRLNCGQIAGEELRSSIVFSYAPFLPGSVPELNLHVRCRPASSGANRTIHHDT